MKNFFLLVGFVAFIFHPANIYAVENSDQQNDVNPSEEITVYGMNPRKNLVGSSIITSKAMDEFNLNSLDQAVNILPGVNVADTGNSRNERMIYVRGFNRFQVPLLMDGIRVYLPSDNRLDYGRFLTPDIEEIQISKGYASVMDGPDGMGGLINLVTRKPKKKLEAEVRSSVGLGHDGEYTGHNVFGYVGTRQEKWYAQLSFVENETDHTDLSSSFKPTPSQPKGKRLFSDSQDWRLNTKIGITPNDTDEYTLSYTRQEGSKRAPLSTVDPLSIQRYWSWPVWNLDSLSFATNTQLLDNLVLTIKIYHNSFDNILRSYDNINENTQTLRKAFNSYYRDYAYGGNIRVDYEVIPKDTISLAFYGRLDEHNEHSFVLPGRFDQPNQKSIEESYSIALENKYSITPRLVLTTAVSYDWRVLDQAQGLSDDNYLINYPVSNKGAMNGQARLEWKATANTKPYISFSDRVRFPTLFERFSTRFNGAVSNPGLKPERAQNYEIGVTHSFNKHVNVYGAFFYSHITDAIVSFPFIYQDTTVTQSRNVGHGNYTGFEMSTQIDLFPSLFFGGNYTYMHQTLDNPSDPILRPTNVPEHKAFLYLSWKPMKKLTLMPAVDIASNRWTSNSAGTNYFKTGHYVNLSMSADYQVVEQLKLSIGAKNLLDQNYQLATGYPEQGRNFYMTLKAVY